MSGLTWKTVPINVINTFGSNINKDAIDQQIATANDVWAPAGIRIQAQETHGVRNYGPKRYSSWKGSWANPHHVVRVTLSTRRRSPRRRRRDVGTAWSQSGQTTPTVVYAQHTWATGAPDNAPGISYTKFGVTAISATAGSGNVLAHKLGHQLGLTYHSFTPFELMFPLNWGGTSLSDMDIGIARASRLGNKVEPYVPPPPTEVPGCRAGDDVPGNGFGVGDTRVFAIREEPMAGEKTKMVATSLPRHWLLIVVGEVALLTIGTLVAGWLFLLWRQGPACKRLVECGGEVYFNRLDSQGRTSDFGPAQGTSRLATMISPTSNPLRPFSTSI